MVLVADSGSTKIDWALIDRNKKVSSFISRGCNPYFMTEKQIFSLFCLVRNYMPSSNVEKIFFYGAGCTGGDKNNMIENALHAAFGEKCKTEVQSDMLGAARALCGRKEGIACILGTGSNSCLFDGKDIVANTPPLGFILGDEGSGAHLGKLLVGNILKGKCPNDIREKFIEKYGAKEEIIDKVYRQPFPNRWLAELSYFIKDNLGDETIKNMVEEAFSLFIDRNVTNYKRPDLKINITGSIAHVYEEIIRKVIIDKQLVPGTITRSPIEGLIAYHNE